ncbi:MAG: hypothetical protein RXO29_04210, partial [Desulfurococcales archaeon]
YSPRIARIKKFINENYIPPRLFKRALVMPIYFRVPDARSRGENHVIYYAPVLGAVPAELSGIYPIGQSVYQKLIGEEEQRRIALEIALYIKKFRGLYSEIELRVCLEHSILIGELKKLLEKENLEEGVELSQIRCFFAQQNSQEDTSE